MKSILKTLLSLGLLSGLLSGLVSLNACAARQQQAETPPQSQQQNAITFIQALFNKQLPQVLSLSAYPFYLNHQAILTYEDEWKRTLEELFATAQPTAVQILSLQLLSRALLEKNYTNEWALLLQYGFDDKYFWLAELQINPSTGPIQHENVLLLLEPESNKIVGFIR